LSGQAPWPEIDRHCDHWQWFPEWRAERPFLWWYLTFPDESGLSSLAADAQSVLRTVEGLDLVPDAWLHLTVQSVDFVDDVPETDVSSILTRATEALADYPPQRLELGPVASLPGAVVLVAGPLDELRALRTRLRHVVAEAGHVEVNSTPDGYWPHVSLAYVNRDCQASAVMERLGGVAERTTDVTVTHTALAAVTRRDRHYKWILRAQIPFAAPTASPTREASPPGLRSTDG
jgi:2'-5' RNA ligase